MPLSVRPAQDWRREMLTLWQRTIHGQLEKHGLLLIGLHQRAASFVVVGIGGDYAFCVLNVLVDAAKIVRVLGLDRGRLLGYLHEQVIVIQAGNGYVGSS